MIYCPVGFVHINSPALTVAPNEWKAKGSSSVSNCPASIPMPIEYDFGQAAARRRSVAASKKQESKEEGGGRKGVERRTGICKGAVELLQSCR